jgi:hypothetical protein
LGRDAVKKIAALMDVRMRLSVLHVIFLIIPCLNCDFFYPDYRSYLSGELNGQKWDAPAEAIFNKDTLYIIRSTKGKLGNQQEINIGVRNLPSAKYKLDSGAALISDIVGGDVVDNTHSSCGDLHDSIQIIVDRDERKVSGTTSFTAILKQDTLRFTKGSFEIWY